MIISFHLFILRIKIFTPLNLHIKNLFLVESKNAIEKKLPGTQSHERKIAKDTNIKKQVGSLITLLKIFKFWNRL